MTSDEGLRNDLREAYDRYAQERDASPMEEWKVMERAAFLSALQKEHKRSLLEIGAGPGRDGRFFREQGLEVVCIDLSPAMVELCRQKGLRAHVMDMLDIDFPEESFDAVYALNSLLHLTKVEFPRVLQRISAILRPGGLAFLGLYGGFEFEGIREQDSYVPKRFFSFFSDEHLEEEVRKVFDILRFQRVFFEGEDPFRFQSLILRKKPS
ncbi:MAG: class I SAM-dependent methyltransferase [Bacteroidota bacterium]